MEAIPSSRCSLSAKQGCRGMVRLLRRRDGRTFCTEGPYLKVSSNASYGFGGNGSSTWTLSLA